MATLHPLVRQGLESTRKKIQVEIDGLQQALQQVDGLLALSADVPAAPASSSRPAAPRPAAEDKPPESKPTTPAPTPRPEGKPTLAEAAKELASTG